MSKPRLVVVGGGVSGAAAVAELRKDGFDGGITLISGENTVPLFLPKTSSMLVEPMPGRGATLRVLVP